MSKRIAVIDADTPLYQAALRGQTTSLDGEKFPLLDIEHVYKDAIRRLTSLMLGATRSDSKAYLCLTGSGNFRRNILPEYKAQRSEKPLMFAELKTLVRERKPWPIVYVEGLEADDLCGILSGQLQAQGKQPVICSDDKDMLQIPGLLFRNKELVEVSPEMGDRFHLMQTLCGDPVDNYKGCPGVGARKADRLFNAVPKADGLAGMWKAVVAQFEAKGLTAEHALVQARVARILRLSDWDQTKKEPILWEPPLSP